MRTKAKDKPVWMRRADEPELIKLQNLLGLRDGRTFSIPEAIGEAIRISLAELERTDGYPRQGGPGPRSWEHGYSPTTGTFTIGPFTSPAATQTEPEDTP